MTTTRLDWLYRLSVCCLFLILVSIWMAKDHLTSVQAQSSCTDPPMLTDRGTWQEGSQVVVNIDPSFTTGQRAALQAAFQAWQTAGSQMPPNGNKSEVTFVFTFNSTPTVGINTEVGLNNYQVTRAQISNDVGQTTSNGGGPGQSETSALTRFDPTNLSNDSITKIMMHEIGHTFGLNDCTTCAPGTSIMIGEDDSNLPSAPTPCDNAVVGIFGGYPCDRSEVTTNQTSHFGPNGGFCTDTHVITTHYDCHATQDSSDDQVTSSQCGSVSCIPILSDEWEMDLGYCVEFYVTDVYECNNGTSFSSTTYQGSY